MKRFAWAILLAVLGIGCGSSSDDFKNYKSIRVEKDGTIALIEEIAGEQQLPKEYHKVYFNKKGIVIKEHLIVSGNPKRSSMYIYNDNGKIDEVRHFESGKYNGVSKYFYNGGSIVREDMYDRDMEFQFSRKYE